MLNVLRYVIEGESSRSRGRRFLERVYLQRRAGVVVLRRKREGCYGSSRAE